MYVNVFLPYQTGGYRYPAFTTVFALCPGMGYSRLGRLVRVTPTEVRNFQDNSRGRCHFTYLGRDTQGKGGTTLDTSLTYNLCEMTHYRVTRVTHIDTLC